MLGLLLYSTLNDYIIVLIDSTYAVVQGWGQEENLLLDFEDGWFREASAIPSELMCKEK